MRRVTRVSIVMTALLLSGCGMKFVGILDTYQPPSEDEQQFRTDLKNFMNRGGYIDQYDGAVAVTQPSGEVRYIAPRRY